MADRDALAAQFKLLQQAFARNLPERLAAIEAAWAVWDGSSDAPALEIVHRLVHSLVGGSGSFGYECLSAAAREAERQLKVWRDTGATVTADERTAMQARLSALRELMHAPDADVGTQERQKG